jgi:hypothetical protein
MRNVARNNSNAGIDSAGGLPAWDRLSKKAQRGHHGNTKIFPAGLIFLHAAMCVGNLVEAGTFSEM